MMNIISSVEEFKMIQDQAKAKLAGLESQIQVKVHLGSCGIASGADKVLEAFNQELRNAGNLTRSCPGTGILHRPLRY